MNSSSLISLHSPSTMQIESSVPATVMSISDCLSISNEGLATNSPLMRPTHTSEIGPAKGISLIINAAEAPTAARVSASTSGSLEKIVAIICVSKCQFLGNIGRIGRSIRRALSISCSLGRLSRLRKPPGNLPAEAAFSRYSTCKGR